MSDFHHLDVPMPMDVSGKPSPRRTKKQKRNHAEPNERFFPEGRGDGWVGQTNETACRTMGDPISAMNNPNQ